MVTPPVEPSPPIMAESVVFSPLILYPAPISSALSDTSKSIPPAESSATSPLTVNPVKVPKDVIFVCAAFVTVAAVPLALPVKFPTKDVALIGLFASRRAFECE